MTMIWDQFTSKNFDFTGFKSITIDWWGYYDSLETNDCVEIKIDNNIVDSWGESGCISTISEDSWLAQSITITDSEYTFDNSVEVKFEGEMNNDQDNFYIDGIKITGRKF